MAPRPDCAVRGDVTFTCSRRRTGATLDAVRRAITRGIKDYKAAGDSCTAYTVEERGGGAFCCVLSQSQGQRNDFDV